jgi:hypothetical protein
LTSTALTSEGVSKAQEPSRACVQQQRKLLTMFIMFVIIVGWGDNVQRKKRKTLERDGAPARALLGKAQGSGVRIRSLAALRAGHTFI